MNETPRVLRVIARMNVGGPARQVTALAEGLGGHGFEHRVLVGDPGDDEADFLELNSADLDVVRIRGLGRAVRFGSDLTALAEIRRQIRSFRPHIVHTHTAKAGALGRIAALSVPQRPRLVHTFHGHLLTGYFSRPMTEVVRQVERALARRTDRILSVGARVRDELLSAGIGRAERYRVVPPGVDLPPLPDRAAARRELRLPPDAPVMAFVGRLTGVKQPLRVLAVAEQLAKRHPDLHIVVAGGGELLEDVRRAGAAFGDRLRLLGWYGPVEVVYRAADVLLLTSDNEGVPMTLIEAAMTGLPAVATNVGSVSEVVLDGRTGFVVSPTVEALATAAHRLLADRALRDRMGTAAAEYASASFGASRLVEDTAAIYRELLYGSAPEGDGHRR